MQLSRTLLTTAAATSLGLSMTAAGLQYQEQPERPDRPERPQWQERQQDRAQRGDIEQLLLHHADDLINAEIRNLENEELGTIDALAIEMNSGNVAYAIISLGGALGVGDTLHAVPYSALKFRPLYEGVVLDVSRSQLEEMPGFASDRLPDFADEQWGRETHEHFGAQPYWERSGTDAGEREFITTYDLEEVDVVNAADESIGTIEDVAMHLRDGKVEFAVLGYGGWLGIGETYAAIPWAAFEAQDLDSDEPKLVLDVTQDQMRDAPEYNMEHWPARDLDDWADHLVGDRRGGNGMSPGRSPGMRPGQ